MFMVLILHMYVLEPPGRFASHCPGRVQLHEQLLYLTPGPLRANGILLRRINVEPQRDWTFLVDNARDHTHFV
jgi:hypothetical protein